MKTNYKIHKLGHRFKKKSKPNKIYKDKPKDIQTKTTAFIILD